MTYLFDASAVIALARAGRLDLLRRAAGPCAVTPEVRRELLGREDATTPAVADALKSWLKLRPRSRPGARYRRLGLGAGEATVLASARPGDTLVLDERPARLLAKSLGIRHTGLIGLLVDAAAEGRIKPHEADEALDALSVSGFWLSPGLRAAARKRLEGEP